MQFQTDLDCEFLGEISAIVYFDYQPAEAKQPNPDKQGVGPGCAEEASIVGVVATIGSKEVEITDIIPKDHMEIIKERAIEFYHEQDEE